MTRLLKTRWPLFVVLLVFISFKIPHLFYPYYWDESWPYAPAIAEMYRHGISLLPGSVQPELSRGHPLFFHALGAAWMHIFGHSRVAMHSMALTISVLFLIAIYEAGIRLFNQRVAILSLLMVATQVLVFVQSSYVLFEMLIAFLMFLSLCFYITNRFLLTAICLSVLFYTKESGLIMGFVLGMDALLRLFDNNERRGIKVKRLVSLGISVIAIGIFFLLQKRINGWYIFPLYNNLIGHDWVHFWDLFRTTVAKGEFIEDSRYYYLFLLIGMSLFIGFRQRKFGLVIILVPAILLYCVAFGAHQNPEQGMLSFATFMITCLAFLYFINRSGFFTDPLQRRFVTLAGLFILCFLVFSSLNFFTYRYLLSSIIPLLFLIAVLIEKYIDLVARVLYVPVIIVLLSIGFYAFASDKGYGDTDPAGFDNMDLQQSVVDYFERNNYYDMNIGVGSFLEREHLIDSTTGFLRNGKTFKNAQWEINFQTDFIVFDNIEPDYRYDEVQKGGRFKLVFRKANTNSWVEVFERKDRIEPAKKVD